MDYQITRIFFVSFAILLLANSCYYDVENELYGTVQCDTPEVVSYDDDIKTLVDNNCATSSCHSSTGSALGNFETYEGLKAKVNNGSLVEAVINTNAMPPSQPLEPCDVSLIEVWINQGALNN